MQEAINQAKERYLSDLSQKELEKYLANKRRQELQRQRKEYNMNLVKEALTSLKGNSKEETAKKIREALIKEGYGNTRVLRAAMKLLYPDLAELKGKDQYQALKPYKVGKHKKPEKIESYIGLKEKVFEPKGIDDKIKAIEELIEKLKQKKKEAEKAKEIAEQMGQEITEEEVEEAKKALEKPKQIRKRQRVT
jgi:hypothetical protein